MNRQVVSTLLLVSSMMSLAACGGGGTSGNFISAPSEGDGSGGGGGGTGGSVSNAGIYITVVNQEQQITTALHKFYDYDTPCTISSSASSAQDLECLLNVRELDLYQQGLKFEFNVPANMCEYIADRPYWFYNREPGYGPTRINVVVDEATPANNKCEYYDNTGNLITGTLTGHNCDFSGANGSSGSATVEGATTCAFDYTSNGGPNCCAGSYTLSTNYKPAVGTAVVSTVTKSWGGSLGRCAAGPYLQSDSGWTFNSLTNLPYQQIRTGLNGFNRYYKITAPIKLKGGDNVYGANFWDWTNYKLGTHPTATLPRAMNPGTDRMGNTIATKPNTAYEFLCLDAAMEVKHRVRLYVNEWDSSAEFVKYLNASTRATATPDAASNATCDITNDFCDDFYGWNWYSSFTPISSQPFPGLDYSTK